MSAAFSNGFEWDCWSEKWCHRCAKDANQDCPLILTAMLGETPTEWVEVHKFGLADRYDCTEFVLAPSSEPVLLGQTEETQP